MPQFDVTTFPSQLFWLFLCFAVLFIVTQYITTPRIRAVLSRRQSQITRDLDQAEQHAREAETYRAQLFEQLENARMKARTAVVSELSTLNAMSSQRRADIIHLVNEEIAAAEDRIEKQMPQSEEDIKAISAQVTTALLECLLSKNVPEADIDQAVGKVVYHSIQRTSA